MKTFNENKFDELFKERFSNYSENPPDVVFNKIKNTTSSFSNYNPLWKKGGFIASVGAVVLIIAGIFIYNYANTFTQNKSTKLLPENNLIANKNTNNNIDNVTTNKTVTNSNNKVLNNINTNIKVVDKVVELDNLQNLNSNIDPVIKSNLPDNNQVPTIQPEYSIKVKVQPATCHNSNGQIMLNSDNENVKFYCLDVNPIKPITFIDKLKTGTYTFKAELNTVSKNFTVDIPDSGNVKARFTHYEMTQAVGVPVYFSNKSTVDGKSFVGIEDVTFKWYFGDGVSSVESEPDYMYNSVGPFTVSLVVCNSIGCKDSTSSMPITIAGSDIDSPNSFSPNGDGINDVFMPAVQGVRTFECVIFNTNGETIYKWNNPEIGWDGKINNGLQMAKHGIYYYIINAVGVDGKVMKYKDFVYLLK